MFADFIPAGLEFSFFNQTGILICFAILVIAVTAWWAVSAWLDNFVYRTQMSWWIFAIAGVGMLFIALVTIGLHTSKAAMSKPVDSLRTE